MLSMLSISVPPGGDQGHELLEVGDVLAGRFEAPGNLICVAVDRATGEPVVDGTDGAINEAFISGTQPARQ